ncbi:MAG: hypothetical protein U0V72_11490 [Cytophagales bacterium]
MKIKSAKSFREWFKNLEKARIEASKYYDEDFIGDKHEDTLGFFHMYHGTKGEIRGFLSGSVEMAEDGQAIYEFVQNAADSNSSKFYMFYDSYYLMVINNGKVFSTDGIKSILNIGQSDKTNDPNQIGKFGIGFKLVHRLIGASTGLDEMLNTDGLGLRGPILFSWSNKSQLDNFLILQSDEFEYVDIDDVNVPWLLKILITNFPAQPTEKVKDINYHDIEPFQAEELKSFQTFLNSKIKNIDMNNIDTGTIFFLKLGENKFEYLEKQKEEYLSGLSTSMHFLKSLETITINEDIITKDINATNVLEFIIPNGSGDFNDIGLTEVRDKESDAKFKVCFADNVNSAIEIKKHPNIYKYFPAVKEVNNLSFVIHSNLFELSSNRQNLTETPINKNLLKLLSQQLINKMEICKTENRSTFKNLFTSILMSEELPSNSSGNGWQTEYFYNILLDYSKMSIPTKNNFSNNAQNIKINKLKLQLNLKDFDLEHIQWFEWDNENDRLLIDEATKKLGIESWDIRDIIENANLVNINNWIASCNNETYEMFLKELEDSSLRKETTEKLYSVKLFKFSDGNFYSVNDIWVTKNFTETYQERTYNQYNRTYKFINKTRVVQRTVLNQSIHFTFNKTDSISNELQNLGFTVSLKNITTYTKIYSAIAHKLPKEKDIYNTIAEKCKTNTLSTEEKKNLFLNFINETTKFDNVAEGTLKDLCLFCDSNSKIKPLNRLIDYKLNTASWLNAYKIKSEEYFAELKSYLISEPEAIFKEIYLPQQDVIISKLTEANEIKSLIKLYQDNKRQFFNEFIIKKTESGFSISKKTSNTYQVQAGKEEVRTFIDKNYANSLFVLPDKFLDYKEEDGVIRTIDLHKKIVEFIDVNEYKETLVDIIHYDEPKHKFLQKLTEFRFNSENEYTKDDYQYKVLNLACNELKERNDIQKFREKVIIATEEREWRLTEISLANDRVHINNKEFSLSKILPATYQNSNLISDLISLFTKQGIQIEKLNALFGVNEELKLKDIFEKFTEQVQTFANPEQFFFLIYYHKQNPRVDLSKLGFELNWAVFPSQFALEKEKLPEYLQNWIINKEIDISELDEIGVFTENSTLVSLREFFLSKTNFNKNTIAEKLSSNKIMLLNTFELLKEKGIELTNDNEFSIFKEIVRVINSSRTKGQELIIQDEYNFGVLEEKSTEWKTINDFSIYLFNGSMPKTVKLDKIQDYIFYQYNDTDFAVNGNSIFINESTDSKKTLQKVASDDTNNFSFEDLWSLFEDNKKDTKQEKQEANSTFLDDVNEFISELEGTEWNDFVPELKNILELSVSHPKEKQKLFNLIAKIKLAKELDIHLEVANKDYNHLENGSEKYFVHSARGAFAYIHPNEILKMKDEGYKMALDFSTKSRIKIYETAEEILQLNTNHILAYQHEKTMDELFSFCQANRDANKHLLIIDKNNSGEKSRALLKLLNIEDDYQ